MPFNAVVALWGARAFAAMHAHAAVPARIVHQRTCQHVHQESMHAHLSAPAHAETFRCGRYRHLQTLTLAQFRTRMVDRGDACTLEQREERSQQDHAHRHAVEVHGNAHAQEDTQLCKDPRTPLWMGNGVRTCGF
eukprot:6212790-Pleurochrysis_carterae.AAC.2